MADGVAPKDVYKVLATDEGVERAFKKLDTIKGDIVWWKAGAQPPQLLASGEVAMTSVYNGRIDTANKNEKKNFGMVWDGALFTLDSWVILKGSPNKDAAYKFLDFAGKAENQSKLSENIAYGTSNKDAAALLAAGRSEGPADGAGQHQERGRDQRCLLAREHRPPDRALQQMGGEIARPARLASR